MKTYNDEFEGEEHEDGTAPGKRHPDDKGSYRKMSLLSYNDLCEVHRLKLLDWNALEIASWFEVSETEIKRIMDGFKPSHK